MVESDRKPKNTHMYSHLIRKKMIDVQEIKNSYTTYLCMQSSVLVFLFPTKKTQEFRLSREHIYDLNRKFIPLHEQVV